MANVGGVPVWSRSGKGAESLAGFGIHNTHNPAVQQRGSVMLVSYSAPHALQGWVIGRIFSSKVFLMWPEQIFDEIGYAVLSYNYQDSLGRIIDACAKKATASTSSTSSSIMSLFGYKSSPSFTWRKNVRQSSVSNVNVATDRPCDSANPTPSIDINLERHLAEYAADDFDEGQDESNDYSNTSNNHSSALHGAGSGQKEAATTSVSKTNIASHTTMLPALTSVMSCGENVWLIGRRGSAYIACYLTSVDEGGNNEIWKINDTLDMKDCYFQCGSDGSSPKEVITRIYTKGNHVSMVVVVGTQDEYPSIENFVNQRLMQISILSDHKQIIVHAITHEDNCGNDSDAEQEIIQYTYPQL
jgi:hypothetical protein